MDRKKILYVTVAAAWVLGSCTPASVLDKHSAEPAADAVSTTTAVKADTPEERNVPNAGPGLDILILFHGDNNGTGLERVTCFVEKNDEQTVLEKLIEYGVLNEETEILSFVITGGAGIGPGIPTIGSTTDETRIGHLDLSQIPETDDETTEHILLNSLAGTFMENFTLNGLELLVNGEPYTDTPLILDMKYNKVYEE